MFFRITVTSFKTSDAQPSLTQVWDFDDRELSGLATDSLEILKNDSLRKHSLIAAWQSQALLEFADLLDLTFPQQGRFFNINFFYFESMSALREAILCALSGCFHASFSVIRSALETFVLHCWWKKLRWDEQTYEAFYDWFEGRRTAPGFVKILPELYTEICSKSPTEADVRSLYARLCSYAHKPGFNESVTTMRGGNQPAAAGGLIAHWLEILLECQRVMLDLAIRTAPQSLFPIDVQRKFGFNPPVGLFFDDDNFIPLVAALGADVVDEYRAHFRDADPPKSQLEWALERRDLSPEEILSSWDGDDPFPTNQDGSQSFPKAKILAKTKMRVISQAMAYSVEGPSMPDLRQLFAALESIESE